MPKIDEMTVEQYLAEREEAIERDEDSFISLDEPEEDLRCVYYDSQQT